MKPSNASDQDHPNNLSTTKGHGVINMLGRVGSIAARVVMVVGAVLSVALDPQGRGNASVTPPPLPPTRREDYRP